MYMFAPSTNFGLQLKLRKPESSQVSGAHLLEGAVKKRQNRFKSALQMSSVSTKNTLTEPMP